MHSIKLSRDCPGGPVAKTLHSSAGVTGSIPGGGGGTRSHMPQLKILHVTTKTSAIKQINIKRCFPNYFLINQAGQVYIKLHFT